MGTNIHRSKEKVIIFKTDLVEADLSEWTHCGDIFEDLRITPNDSELEIPACFRREREQEINCRKGVIDDVLNKLGFTDEVIACFSLLSGQ